MPHRLELWKHGVGALGCRQKVGIAIRGANEHEEATGEELDESAAKRGVVGSDEDGEDSNKSELRAIGQYAAKACRRSYSQLWNSSARVHAEQHMMALARMN